jgi:sucrose-6-phosphate hydrolase SacC (GH32 family)
MAWGRVEMPGMPFNQMMLFPVTLTLRTTEEGPRMYAEPVREIEKLHKKQWRWKNEILKPAENLLSGISGEVFHIRAELKVGDALQTGFVIRDVPVIYDVQKQRLSCHEKTASLKPVDGIIQLELLVDRTSIEIFGNDGRVYIPTGVILADNSKSLEIFTKGGNTEVQSLEIYELNSTWK